jgi:putative phosphoribosyl transferase
VAAQCPVSGAWLDAALAEQMREMARRRKCYLSGEPRAAIAGRTVILTDDGIATGTTVRAALKALRQARVRRVILAVPVAPPDEIAALRGQVDRVVCLATPVPFGAVGAFYRDFHQLSDDEVVTLVQEAHATCRPDQVHPSSL